jgi:nucleoside-diphosphate-sugar epimerase
MEHQRGPSTSRILVTGATGFVGRHLLSLAPAVRLRAAVRTGVLPRLDGVESVIVGNIDAGTDWSLALTGIESVVHLAARVHVMHPGLRDRQEFEAVNIGGTTRLASAAAQAGVKRFVFLSTVKVNGETSGARAFRADDPPNPADDYARSKLDAERELMRIAVASGMQTVFIRSPLVYGPGVRANFLKLLSWAYRGIPLPLASIDNSRSLVSVWNLCDLIHAVLRHSEPINGAVMVSDGHDVSTGDLIRLLARALRRPARLFPVPLALLRASSRLVGAAEEFSRLCSSLTVDIADTRERLGWSPPLTLESGLSRTAEWYLEAIRQQHG